MQSSSVWVSVVRCILVGILLIIIAVAIVIHKKQQNQPAPSPASHVQANMKNTSHNYTAGTQEAI